MSSGKRFQLALIPVWLNYIATPSSFRLNDPLSFVQGAMVFETVAGSAYIIAGSHLKQDYDLIFAEVCTPLYESRICPKPMLIYDHPVSPLGALSLGKPLGCRPPFST